MPAASLTADRRRVAQLRETALGLAHPRSGVSAAEIARCRRRICRARSGRSASAAD
jgi:hypothetical protein